MKRLLAYLFLVLGLGLVFSVNANSNITILERTSEKIILHVPYGTSGAATIARNHCNRFNKNFVMDKGTYQTVYKGKKGSLIFYICKGQIQTQTAKKEPSQTQEVAKGNPFCIFRTVDQENFIFFPLSERAVNEFESFLKKYTWTNIPGIKKINLKDRDDILNFCHLKIYESSYPFQYNELLKYWMPIGGAKSSNLIYKKTLAKYLGNTLYAKLTKDDETQIAKKEPKKKEKKVVKKEKKVVKKEKKKKKVAKVVEQEQEEIKIKTKKLDTTGPEIEIAEAITVDDSSYSLKGKVSDKGSDKIYIKVDGQDIPVKKGKFKIDRYSPEDEEVKIVAIDKWGNKSIKVVKVTIDIQEDIIVQKLEPLNPSRVRAKTSGEKVALIIGIENYTESPNAQFANLDAKYFFDYARKAFGVKKQNIKMLIDEEATFVKTNKAITKWLKGKIINDKSELIIFFAGHGLASSDGKELFLLSQDSDPDMLSITALSRNKLFETIIGLNPKSVTMFLDTCYSGVSRDEQMLLASARPIRIVADEQEGIPDNFTIFSASQLDQISSGLKEANHGIFSYYLMKGLEGKADENKDNKITNGELLAYMNLNVSQKASELGRQQNPSLAGDPDKVLMSYR